MYSLNFDLINETNVKVTEVPDTDYKVYKYRRDALNTDNATTLGLWRSVITKNDKIVCFAPPKSVSIDNFMDGTYGSMEFGKEMYLEQYVEGTMMNVFYDGEEWECATRSIVGGRSKFFKDSKKTFREMFLEAMNECGLEFEHLDKHFCYSFVFRHPEHRIVEKVVTPMLFLCEVFEIDAENSTVRVVPFRTEIPEILNLTKLYTPFSYAPYLYGSYGGLFAAFTSEDTHFTNMGVILKDTSGVIRSKIRNPKYTEVRELRSNHPRSLYNYLDLRKGGKHRVMKYLTYYTEDRDKYEEYKNRVNTFTTTLYSNYVKCFIKKDAPLQEFGYQYRNHMVALHELYKAELRPIGAYINKYRTIMYVNNLHPARLMYSLNYYREQNNEESRQSIEESIQEDIA